ncbi:MAG: hypothetical protein ACYTFW_01880 [Planctomycetota bacterium]|jgi:hypothetical protein
MDEKVRKTIEEIMGQLKCPKNFKCAESEFEVLCKAKRIGLDSYLECLEPDPPQCKFASPFRNCYLCKCPVRIYVFEKLN